MFATLHGNVGSTATSFNVTPANFSLAHGKVQLEFICTPDSGSGLTPGKLLLKTGKGKKVSPIWARVSSGQSVGIFKVGVGTYTLVVPGLNGTIGAFSADVVLAGDANSDGQVNAADVKLITSLQKTTSSSTSYSAAADVNLDGVIDKKDLSMARSGVGSAVRVNPLTVLLSDASDPGGTITLSGTTAPGAKVDLGHDGVSYNDAQTTADASGNFTFSGFNAQSGAAYFARATDTFGQQAFASDTVGGPPTTDASEAASPGVLSISGISASGFNPLDVTPRFQIDGASFSTDPSDFSVWLNGQEIDATALTLATDSVSFEATLNDGRNELDFLAQDHSGLDLESDTVLWAGDHSLTAQVVGPDGQPAADGTPVEARLGDDQSVVQQGMSSGGQVVFSNVPNRTIILKATTADNSLGVTGGTGNAGTMTVKLIAFDAPSAVDNNDLSQGTAGWNVESGQGITIVNHAEGLPATSPAASASAVVFSAVPLDSAPVDQDLQVSTHGVEGETAASRTFVVAPGVKSVTLRYRFITAEVPGGYFGSQYNDYFRVSLRSEKAGGVAMDSNSMNGLGLAAFDYNSGATEWRQVTLPVSVTGDTIQADVGVANVGDNLYDSTVVVDQIQEQQLAINSLSLTDIDGSALQFISGDSHTYFGGNTELNGTIDVSGSQDDSLKSVDLQVVQGGAVVATGHLAPDAAAALLNQPFGTGGHVSISSNQLLFQLPSDQAALIDSSQPALLRVHVTSANGQEASKDWGSVKVLVHYTGTNRYGGRDEDLGGDDWILPGVRDVLDHYASQVTYGDMSNMNGGPFSPHSSHRNGVDVDGWYSGYNARDAAAAQTMISLLNDSEFGSRIQLVFVAYKAKAGDPFYDAINGVTLADGRLATSVIRPDAGHKTHFHWRISPN